MIQPDFKLERTADLVGRDEQNLVPAPKHTPPIAFLDDIPERNCRAVRNPDVVPKDLGEGIIADNSQQFGLLRPGPRLCRLAAATTSRMHRLYVGPPHDLSLRLAGDRMNVVF